MPKLEREIKIIQNLRLDVYRSDEKRIIRDYNSAKRVADDHVDRWLFELLQNSDDAKADHVEIIISNKAIYVADNGNGVKKSAVDSLSGTDFSDKSADTIGRKGIGFKAVYNITLNPQIFSLDNEGLEYSKLKAKKWFKEKSLPFESTIPYQWIPFFLSREKASKTEPILTRLRDYSTIVKLPGATDYEHINELKAEMLLTFRHIRKVSVTFEDDDDFEIAVEIQGSNTVETSDTRLPKPVMWQVLKRSKLPPINILSQLDPSERRRIEQDKVSFVVAAPKNNEGEVIPSDSYLPMYVFYPVDNDISPIPVLLHAEFLVRSDRTEISKIKEGSFNSWVAKELAKVVIKFVAATYRKTNPSAFLRLLNPYELLENQQTSEIILKEIIDQAVRKLKLPDISANLVLTGKSAKMLSVSTDPELARHILYATPVNRKLLHPLLDLDAAARETLKIMNCNEIQDDDIIKTISSYSKKKLSDHAWLGYSWKWLYKWANAFYFTGKEECMNKIKDLPVVPIRKNIYTMNALKNDLVTWKESNTDTDVPEWLPIRFLPNWFRTDLLSEDSEEISQLLDDLGIMAPSNKIILEATVKAIKRYWENNVEYKPKQFIDLILQKKWYETHEAPEGIDRCPVMVRKEGNRSTKWEEARKTYLGSEWDNPLLSKLYRGVKDISWAVRNKEDQNFEIALEWLGVASYPRIVERNTDSWEEYLRRKRHLEYGDVPKRRDPPTHLLDRLELSSLKKIKTEALLQLLAIHWDEYYDDHTTIPIGVEGPQRGGRSDKRVPAFWWEYIQEEFNPPVRNNSEEGLTLKECFIPDSKTISSIGELIPIIEVNRFNKDLRQVTISWLKKELGVRSSLTEISSDEWIAILAEKVPYIANATSIKKEKKLGHRIIRWYVAALESLEDQIEVPDGVFRDVPLLCSKGRSLKYISDDTKWLSDDVEIAEAYHNKIWQIALPEKSSVQARKYMGLKSLSDSADVSYALSGEKFEDRTLSITLKKAIPYIYVWRCFKKSGENEKLKSLLKKLNVTMAENIKKTVSLETINSTLTDRQWGLDGNKIFISSTSASREASLASALAVYLDVKSEADFFENMLKSTQRQRKQKLLNNNVSEAEIIRLLTEFDEETFRLELSEEVEETASVVGAFLQGDETEKRSAINIEELIIPKDEVDIENVAKEESEFYLKDLDSAEIVFVDSLPSKNIKVGGSGGGGGGGGRILTEEEKRDLEKKGRDSAEKMLKREGWDVEQLAYEQPGFDLRATKDDHELLVEVKAHLAQSYTLELTRRQYSEYIRFKNDSESVKWELWNIENLSKGSEAVRITRIDTLTDEALEEKSFTVDTRLCEPLSGSISWFEDKEDL